MKEEHAKRVAGRDGTMSLMETDAQKRTLISTVLQYVNLWRKSRSWSRETVVQVIVETHEKINGPTVTDIRFEGSHPDVFMRQKTNADRVFRWLDDSTKDNNLLPANFLPSILAAMPVGIRIQCVNEMLQPAELTVRTIGQPLNETEDFSVLLPSLLKESGEANVAVANLLDGATQEELAIARTELTESIEIQKSILEAVETVHVKRLKGS